MALPKITFAGSGERSQYLPHKANDTIIHFVLNYPEIVDADVLRAATKALVESVDVLHSSFFVDPNVAYLPLVTLLLYNLPRSRSKATTHHERWLCFMWIILFPYCPTF